MAATLGGNEARTRRFQIGRENGSKTGKAILLEWLSELPAGENKGRKFETRTSESGTVRHYEVFSAIDGTLADIYKATRKIMDEERTFLYLVLDDGADTQQIEIGDIDGRYCLNLLPRLLNPAVDFSKKLRVSPYAFEADGKTFIGVSLFNGVDKVDRPADGTLQQVHPEISEFKGKKLYNFMPVFEALWKQVEHSILPKLSTLPSGLYPTPMQAAAATVQAAGYAPDPAFPQIDKTSYQPDSDLPF